jgi:universal stress protein A
VAFDIAVELAASDGSRITVLHVIELIADTPREELADFYDGVEQRAFAEIDEIVDAVEDSPVEFRREILYGRRAREILRFVRENDVDLLVLQSHRIRREDPSYGLGTLSHEIAVFAECPVMLVK